MAAQSERPSEGRKTPPSALAAALAEQEERAAAANAAAGVGDHNGVPAPNLVGRATTSTSNSDSEGDAAAKKRMKRVRSVSPLPTPTTPSIVISVEGSIGSGKSTFLRILRKHMEEAEVLQEPVGLWKNVRGENLLQKFYQDPKRWAYTFQSYAFVTRLMMQAKMPYDAPVRILERSALSDKYIFAQNAYESGLMDLAEWNAYQNCWDFYTAVTPGRPNGIIYLSTNPETCMKRMKARARPEEKGVPVEYLRMLEQKHRSWLPDGAAVSTDGIPFIALDADIEFKENTARQAEMVEAVRGLLAKIRAQREEERAAPAPAPRSPRRERNAAGKEDGAKDDEGDKIPDTFGSISLEVATRMPGGRGIEVQIPSGAFEADSDGESATPTLPQPILPATPVRANSNVYA